MSHDGVGIGNTRRKRIARTVKGVISTARGYITDPVLLAAFNDSLMVTRATKLVIELNIADCIGCGAQPTEGCRRGGQALCNRESGGGSREPIRG